MTSINIAQDPRFKNQLLECHNLADYLREYHKELGNALAACDANALEGALQIMQATIKENRSVFVCGNGGSCAIADHLACDWMKGTRGVDGRTLRVVSLCSNNALNSAISNDFGFEHSFALQVEMLAKKNDVLVLISSSGNSQNILNAAETAKKIGVTTIGLTGFSGGKLKNAVDVSLYVKAENYGIVEDAHQIIMHGLAQSLVKRLESPSK